MVYIQSERPRDSASQNWQKNMELDAVYRRQSLVDVGIVCNQVISPNQYLNQVSVYFSRTKLCVTYQTRREDRHLWPYWKWNIINCRSNL
jgi:hypothetical protein